MTASTTKSEAALPATETRDELRRIAAWIRTPGNINRDDAIDECARVLENLASAGEARTPPTTDETKHEQPRETE